MCGSPVTDLPSADPTPPRETTRTVRQSPDLTAARDLVSLVSPKPVRHLLGHPTAMCVVCGADIPPEADRPAQSCPACGSPRVLVPDPAPETGPALGTLYRRRAGLRRKWAMLTGQGATGYNLLLHNGKTVEIAADAMPAPAEPDLGGMAVPTLRSPAARMLLYGTAAVALPWAAGVLLDHAFRVIASAPWYARAAALDVLALNRPDLLPRCGLSPAETGWLRLVYSARCGDHAGVVEAAAALPPDRYRHKIAVLAAFAGRIATLPGVATQLSPPLCDASSGSPRAPRRDGWRTSRCWPRCIPRRPNSHS
jgi:hypothetical protein